MAVTQTPTGESSRTVTRQFDAQGRLIQEVTPEGTLSYEYNDLGRKTATIIGTPESPERVTSYIYDELSRLVGVSDDLDVQSTDDTPLTHSYGYDLAGRLASEVATNGVMSVYDYDSLGRLNSVTHTAADGSVIASFVYTVRNDGRRTQLDQQVRDENDVLQSWTVSYEYDALNRLVSETFDTTGTVDDWQTTYTMDLTGNREFKETDDQIDGTVDEIITYDYDVNDRLLYEWLDENADSSIEQTTEYGYDLTQQTSKTVTDAGSNVISSVDYTYDLQSRLETVTITTDNKIETATYDYDHTGIRVSSIETVDLGADGTIEETKTTTYLNDKRNFTGYSQVIREVTTDGSGTEIKKVDYAIGHDQISQTVYDAQDPTGVTHHFHKDGHTNTRVLTATSAAVLQQYIYDVYDVLLNMALSDALTSELYASEHFDSLTGFSNNRERYYNPLIGRWNRADEFIGNLNDPLSFNKYVYVHSDPGTGLDPSGREFTFGALSARLGSFASMVGQQLPTFARIGGVFARGIQATTAYMRENAIRWFVNSFFPTGVNTLITVGAGSTSNAFLGAWFGATFGQYLLRAGFTAGLSTYIGTVSRDTLLPAVSELRQLGEDLNGLFDPVDFAAEFLGAAGIGVRAEDAIGGIADQIERSLHDGVFDSQTAFDSLVTGQAGLGGSILITTSRVNRFFSNLAALNIVTNEVIRIVYDALPHQGKQRVVEAIGFPNGIDSILISPNYESVTLSALMGDLHPERHVRNLRTVVRDLRAGGTDTAAADLVHSIRALRQYGTVTVNGVSVI